MSVLKGNSAVWAPPNSTLDGINSSLGTLNPTLSAALFLAVYPSVLSSRRHSASLFRSSLQCQLNSAQFRVINPHGDDGFESKQSSLNSNQPTGINDRVREREREMDGRERRLMLILCWRIKYVRCIRARLPELQHTGQIVVCPWERDAWMVK